MRVSCFLQVFTNSVLFSSSCHQQCLIDNVCFLKVVLQILCYRVFLLSPTVSCFLQVVTNSILFSSSCHQQCLVSFKFLFPHQKLSPTVSCFLQVVTNSVLFSSSVSYFLQVVLFSSSCHQQCLVFFKLCMTMSCFLQIVCESVLFSSSFHQ